MAAKKTAAKSANRKAPRDGVSSSLAKLGDGTIQITFKIPANLVAKTREKALDHIGANMEISGFRKGKAPKDKVAEKVGETKIVEHTLRDLLPELTAKVIKEHKLRIAIYPRYEIISTQQGEDWQVRANTCELPEVDLGDYKKAVRGSAGSAIWTPDSVKTVPGRANKEKAKAGEEKQPTQRKKEAQAIKALLKMAKIQIPRILVDEEVNSRLSRLLERLEKLGINLETYLASNGKTSESLRKDYETQAKETITLDLVLSKIASEEGLKVPQKDLNAALKVNAEATNTKDRSLSDTAKMERENMIRAALLKRAALDYVLGLI